MRLPRFGRTAPAAYRRCDDVVAASHGGRTILMSVSAGQYYALDPVGGRVWELLETTPAVDAIARLLAEEYDAPLTTIRDDVAELLAGMQRDRLVRAA